MNIRAVYGTPCRSQYFCKRGNVSGTIDVRVRHVTTLGTHEAVFNPLPQFMAYRACLARIRRIHVIHGYSSPLRFVSHKVLKLSPSPSVQPRPHPFPGFDPVPNVGQVFQTDFRSFTRNGFRDNRFGNNMIYVCNVPTFLARDFAKTLFGALRTVGLETPTMTKKLVSIVSQFTTIKQTTTGRSRDVVLTYVTTHNTTSGGGGRVGYIQNQIEKPLAPFTNKFRFLGLSRVHQVPLMLSAHKLDTLSTGQGKQGQRIVFKGIGAFIIVNRSTLKADFWDRFVFVYLLIGLKRFIGIRHALDSITGHLAAKLRDQGANRVVGQMMQGDTVPAAMLNGNGNNNLTRPNKMRSQIRQSLRLFGRWVQFQFDCAFHICNYTHDQIALQVKGDAGTALSIPGMNAEVSRAIG